MLGLAPCDRMGELWAVLLWAQATTAKAKPAAKLTLEGVEAAEPSFIVSIKERTVIAASIAPCAL